ncbi:hypothetical protein SAMN05519103_08533 [Rhizobiales bacterium GAS113]|nr:hypothetical protein SAMN05519103_08533 [Rhizobiales bacterium GAS113]
MRGFEPGQAPASLVLPRSVPTRNQSDVGEPESHVRCGKIKVGPWPDKTGWSKGFSQTVGACFMKVHRMPKWQQVAQLFLDFHTAVVRDGIDPQAAHEAFLAIDEYRRHISPDIKGGEVD